MTPACRRDSSDPLFHQLFAVRKLHLVSPRVGYAVGEVIIEKPDGDTWEVFLSDLFDDAPTDLLRDAGQFCADVEDKVSGKFEAKTVVGFLHGIAAAFGVQGSAKLAAAYGDAKTLRVRARGVTCDRIDLGKAARFLNETSLRSDQGLYSDGDRIYLIREVVRADAVEVAAQNARDQALNISAESTGLAQAQLALSAHNDYAASVVYKAKQPAAFGLRLVEVVAEPPNWSIKEVQHPVAVRGGEAADATAPDAIIGDPASGRLFLELRRPPA